MSARLPSAARDVIDGLEQARGRHASRGEALAEATGLSRSVTITVLRIGAGGRQKHRYEAVELADEAAAMMGHTCG